MKKLIIAVVAVIILLGAGGGGAYFYLFKMKHPATTAVQPPPKPIVFAQISNLVVSVPASAATPSSTGSGSNSSGAGNTPNQVFIELSVQFATTDPKAVNSFNALLPIIQASMVSLLMKQTATQLMNPDTHAQLSHEFLDIANGVLEKNQYFKPANPFTAAYITNIVQQD